MSSEVKACREVLRDVLAPLIEKSGGELYAVLVDDRNVKLHLAGKLSGSPACGVVTERLVSPAVRKVHPKARLEVTNGWTIPEGAEKLSS